MPSNHFTYCKLITDCKNYNKEIKNGLKVFDFYGLIHKIINTTNNYNN